MSIKGLMVIAKHAKYHLGDITLPKFCRPVIKPVTQKTQNTENTECRMLSKQL